MSRTANQIQAQLGLQNGQPGAVNIIQKNYYGYDFVFPTVASGASATASVQIQADANFFVQAMTYFCWDLTANAAIVPPYATAQITVQSSGTTFFDVPVPVSSFAGDGRLPFILPEARIIPMNALVVMALTNVVSANADFFQITMHGKKLFSSNPGNATGY